VLEPLQYCNHLDQRRTHGKHYRLATCAWERIKWQQPELSADFERGFKDGFADYLDFGGIGEPPPLPPRTYWKNRYQSPAGYAAVEDWFAGFRQGAADAEASGWRNYATVPSSVGISDDMISAGLNQHRDRHIESIPAPAPTSIPIEVLPPVRAHEK
jgi:hypothetical protein